MILSLRWDEVDFERGHLRLTHTKTGKSVRPQGQSAAEILRGLVSMDDSQWVFPGKKPGEHLKEIRRVWTAVRHAAGLDELRLHDLRHSFASVPAVGGESRQIIRSLLGHARIKTTERYAHLGNDQVKRAADRTSGDIAAWLSGADTAIRRLPAY